jgi:hypothetical protein
MLHPLSIAVKGPLPYPASPGKGTSTQTDEPVAEAR